MRVMVTGASGLIGRALVNRLLADGSMRGRAIEALLILDQTLIGFPEDTRLRRHIASINDAALLRRALADGVDVVFHLVSVPSGTAEVQYDRGYESNLLGSLELMQQLRGLKRPPVLVYASSTEVYGGDVPVRMKASQTLQPQLSYGAHKLMVEIALSDLARRGEVDGRVTRLPPIVAREKSGCGDSSTFMSELLHAYALGEAYCCPVSPHASVGWMSVRCCIDNLLHAAGIDDLGSQRVWQLPVLRLSIAQVLDALAASFGTAPRALITFAPDAKLEGLLGRFTQVKTLQARALGFHHDGSATALIRNAFDLRPASSVSAKARK